MSVRFWLQFRLRMRLFYNQVIGGVMVGSNDSNQVIDDSIKINLWDDYYDDGYVPDGNVTESNFTIEDSKIDDSDKIKIIRGIKEILSKDEKLIHGILLYLDDVKLRLYGITHKHRKEILLPFLQKIQLSYNGREIKFISES